MRIGDQADKWHTGNLLDEIFGECDCHCVAPATKKTKRQLWTSDETAAVKRHFATHLLLHRVPRKHECVKCKDSEPAVSSRDWKSIKFWVHTAIQKNKRVLFSHD